MRTPFFKGGQRLKADLATKRRFVANLSKFQSKLSERLLKIKHWFLVQIKAENHIFQTQKFFTPLFLPPMLLMSKKSQKLGFFTKLQC